MTSTANADLMARIRRYGAFDVSACFSCGACTATCPLSTPTASFPRKLIHSAQLGLKDKLLGPDVWLCESCGECSDTCPRDAKPSDFMIALRKYEISELGVPQLSRPLLTSRTFAVAFLAALSLVVLGILALIERPPDLYSVELFGFLPETGVEIVGIAIGFVALGTTLVGVLRLWRRMARAAPLNSPPAADGAPPAERKPWIGTIGPTLREALLQRRTQTCASEKGAAKRWTSRRFVHLMVFWGFLGLLLATILRFVVVPIHGALVPPWEPVRLLGIVSGAALLCGTSLMIVRRLRKADRYTSRTTFMDWAFILLLFLAGLGGFLVDFAQYASQPFWAYAFLLFHLVVVFDLLILIPFTKFAHVVYRPLALWLSRVYGYLG